MVIIDDCYKDGRLDDWKWSLVRVEEFFFFSIHPSPSLPPLKMEATDQLGVSVPAAVKLTRDEEDYLDRLLTEKKVVDATTGLDCTQKLINAGKSTRRPSTPTSSTKYLKK